MSNKTFVHLDSSVAKSLGIKQSGVYEFRYFTVDSGMPVVKSDALGFLFAYPQEQMIFSSTIVEIIDPEYSYHGHGD